MNFHQPSASAFIPDGKKLEEALPSVSHLAIGAHQDDVEFMAFHGIAACYDSQDSWFGAVTCTNGAGSARTGRFAEYTDEDMMRVRRTEQEKAASLGNYAVVVQLDYPSARVKDPEDKALQEDLTSLLTATSPSVVYTHNPADKHDTHIGVLTSTLAALRALPEANRPNHVYGCEVWRGLDWMLDEDKVALDVSTYPALARELAQVFESQIEGGKHYDLAVEGRGHANATFFESHGVDEADRLWFAMDLTPLIVDASLKIEDHVRYYLDRFRDDVLLRLTR